MFDFHEMQVCEFKGGYQMLYCGGSTPTPWDTEREYTEEQYVSRFAELLPQVRRHEPLHLQCSRPAVRHGAGRVPQAR